MNHACSERDLDYLKAFLDSAIDPAEFHHREHLWVVYALIVTRGAEEALEEMREGILRLLRKAGAGVRGVHRCK